MNNDTNSDRPSADTYGFETPPRELAHEEEKVAPRGPVYESASPARLQPPNYVRWIGGCLIALVAILLLCGGGTAVLASIALNSTPATATVDKTFSVSDAPALVIQDDSGSVHVSAGGDGQVSFHATKRVRAFTHDQAQSELDAITITTNQTGNVVTIQVDSGNTVGLNPFNYHQIDLNLTTPSHTNLTVVENAGSLDATGLTGKLTTEVNAGSVTLSTMTMANSSSLRINAGSLSLDGALESGASLNVNVNAGSADLTLPKDTSAHLDASASAGSVNVNGWNIAQIRDGANVTAIGDLNPNPTDSITIRVTAGSASLNAA